MNLTEQTVEPDVIIDPETGLPELPEGYAWRVEPYGERFLVEVVKRIERKPDWIQRLFGAKPQISWTTFGEDNLFRMAYGQSEYATEDSLKECAKRIYLKATEKHSTLANQIRLQGIYPPKSLNS